MKSDSLRDGKELLKLKVVIFFLFFFNLGLVFCEKWNIIEFETTNLLASGY